MHGVHKAKKQFFIFFIYLISPGVFNVFHVAATTTEPLPCTRENMNTPIATLIIGAMRKSHPVMCPSIINTTPAMDVMTNNEINAIDNRVTIAFTVFLSILSLFKERVSIILV